MQSPAQKIVVLATGGTIAGTAAQPGDNIGYVAAQLGADALLAAVPALAGAPLETEQVAQVDSKDMDAAIWLRLAQRVAFHAARAEVAGLVITHGTDTLEETGYFLQRVLAPRKPVVLTAAMRPATALLRDGPQNLLDAVTVAREPGAAGVVVVLAGVVWDARELRKQHTYRVDAFGAGDAGWIARVEEGRLRRQRDWPAGEALEPNAKKVLSEAERAQAEGLVGERIATRRPAAYLTREAWLQNVPFYVDERVIVPRSYIAELLADVEGEGTLDAWLSERTQRVLDLCTGNGSLAVIAALAYPDISVDAAELSADALAVARINVDRHGLGQRITLLASDLLASVRGPYDLIVCNPPYVNAQSMSALPDEYRHEPAMALAGGDDGMDLVRRILRDAPARMSPDAVLLLEIGNERPNFEHAFRRLEVAWMETSAGDDQVLLVTRDALARWSRP